MKSAIRIGLSLFVASLCWGATPAPAGYNTYTESVVGSGSFGGVDFADRLITISMTVDAATIHRYRFGYETSRSLATIAVDGVGVGTILAIVNAETENELVISFVTEFDPSMGPFSDVDLLAASLDPPPVPDYDLTTALGPVAGPGQFDDIHGPYVTSNGGFSIASISGDVTFQAVVPEPSSLMLCGVSCLGGLAWARARREAASGRPGGSRN